MTSSILLISFLLAFCSLFYELIFSQLISVFIGSTILSYSLGIGVFVLALGIGSVFYDTLLSNKSKNLKRLFYIELALAFSGLVGGYVVIIFAQLITSFPFLLQTIILLFPIIIVGFLSGMELPLLMGEKQELKEKLPILGLDFIGMFSAAILFPVCFFLLGLFKTSIIISFINLGVAYTLLPKKNLIIEKIIILFIAVGACLLFIFDFHLSLFRQSLFLRGIA